MGENCTITGSDAWGRPVTETISLPAARILTRKDHVRNFIAYWVFNGSYPLVGVRLHNLGWRWGFHKWRMITRIIVDDRPAPAREA